MPRLTTDQVMGLAPDAASASAGRGLASESNWVTIGMAGDAVWGEAKGSGKLPYQTAVDLGGIAYKCSCPSRKIPCKHALGLLLRYAQDQIPQGDPPTWVAEWLEKRTEKVVKKTETPSIPNPEAAAARAEKRWKNILDGLDECEAFLTDAVAQGLIAANSTRTWDQMAARIVDAQAPGLANRLNRIGSGIGVGPDWVTRVVPQLGTLSLLIEAAKNLDRLDSALQADVKSALGIAIRKEDLGGEPVIDIWDVVGQSQTIEDRLTVYRSWLRGRATQRWALHLVFVAPGQMSTGLPIPGTALAGALRFHPSAWPLRAEIEEAEATGFQPRPGLKWSLALDEVATGWSKSPWVEEFPVQLSQATFGVKLEKWLAIDSEGNGFEVKDALFSKILALSGNHPCELFGDWDGKRLNVLSAWGDWGFVRF